MTGLSVTSPHLIKTTPIFFQHHSPQALVPCSALLPTTRVVQGAQGAALPCEALVWSQEMVAPSQRPCVRLVVCGFLTAGLPLCPVCLSAPTAGLVPRLPHPGGGSDLPRPGETLAPSLQRPPSAHVASASWRGPRGPGQDAGRQRGPRRDQALAGAAACLADGGMGTDGTWALKLWRAM